MSEQATPPVPTLDKVRKSGASLISKVVEYFQNGNHSAASADEIVDGISITNKAERQTVYSTMDPYTEGAVKRDNSKPLLFRRGRPGEYEFLGYRGDPLDLTSRLQFDDPVLSEAYAIFLNAVQARGLTSKFQGKTVLERINSFHQTLESNPQMLRMAQERILNRENGLNVEL